MDKSEYLGSRDLPFAGNFSLSETGNLPQRMAERLADLFFADYQKLLCNGVTFRIYLGIFYNVRRTSPQFQEITVGVIGISAGDQREIIRFSSGFFRKQKKKFPWYF